MPSPSSPIDETIVRELEPLIAALTEAHEEMLALTLEHRSAISRADAAAIARCIERQGQAAARIGDLEVQRRRMVALASPAGRPVTLTNLAERLPEPDRARVIAAAARLRDTLTRLQRETRTVRAATESLLAHMNGLMQQVARTLSQTRLYGPQGRIAPGAPVACGIDLTH